MKLLIWKLVWKVVCKWQEVALDNDLWEQFKECEEILHRMKSYKKAMVDKGIWEND